MSKERKKHPPGQKTPEDVTILLCLSLFGRKFHQISLDKAFYFTIHHSVYIRGLEVGTMVFTRRSSNT